ncbi:MAG: PEP-CTERM sorting domain-containing protein [Gammaproteobacteria bacterium]
MSLSVISRAGTSTLAVFALLATFGLAQTANAVPCGNLFSGGVAPSIACQNGPDGDRVDSAADLNAGSFFGINSWNLLDNTRDGVDQNYWSFLGGNPNAENFGIGRLAAGIWNSFSSLAIVLNGRGGALDNDVKWAAYQMAPGDRVFAWTYDYLHKLGNASLYGVSRVTQTTTVPEPAALALVLVGLGVGAAALRRKRQH